MNRILVAACYAIMSGSLFFLIASGFRTAAVSQAVDTRNATFSIEGQNITLLNGYAEVSAAPNSVAKIMTKYFGNEAVGDFNDDGLEDTAFIVTQDGGGSGTFYYVVAYLAGRDGYKGTNAVLLGDRIAPQSTEFRNSELMVSYADRFPGQSMSVPPFVGKTMTLEVKDGKLLEVKP